MGQAYDDPDNRRITLIGLGSNVTSIWGDPAETIKTALSRLSKALSIPLRESRRFLTPAYPAGAGPNFVNAAAAFETEACAAEILAVLHGIEAEAGRTREVRWGQRTLDLDLIAQGDQVLPDRSAFDYWRNLPASQQASKAPTELILPHPRMQDRAFVLVPLADVAPDWVHPVLGQSVEELCAALPQSKIDSVLPLG